ncbi:MAG TPA: ATP-binding SpoIIE family protein phosphatase [Mycobacteriales bacterium]|nr:ATP-binding SpoIIE family protein phosphatase [Mycobacteriales bacterium]
MPEPWREELRLPPDETAPGRARAFVRRVLEDHGWTYALENALLLTTELTTNAVVHAGTAVRVDVAGDADTVTVRVQDHTPGRLSGLPRAPDELHEGGRGLYLVDSLSTTWGTEHSSTGKVVWFRFARSPAEDLADPAGDQAPADLDRLAAVDLGWLTAGGGGTLDRLTLPEFLREILWRSMETLDADAGIVVVDEEDTGDPVVVAHNGLPEDTLSELRKTLAVSAHTVRPPASARGLLGLVSDAAVTAVPLRLDGSAFGWVELRARGDDRTWSRHDLGVTQLAAARMSLAVTGTRLGELDQRRRGWLSFLAEASELLAGSLDVRLTLPLVAQLVLPSLATWSAVYLLDERDQAALAAVGHIDERRVTVLRECLDASEEFTEAVADALRTSGSSPLDAALFSVVEAADPRVSAPERSGLIVPLRARGRVVGGVVLVRPRGPRHTAEERTLAEDLARRAGLAVDNARLYSDRAGVARALQAWLLPPELPTTGDVEFAARYLAAGEGNEVGGDFYDVFDLPEGGWGLAVGDVCGKGAEAAAVTGLVRDVIRLMVRDGHQVPEVLHRLNRAILEQGDRGRFCTVAAARLLPDGDDLLLRVSSAGHPLPVVIRAAGHTEFVGRAGMVVGVTDDFEVHEEDVHLARGDAVVFYTDGVTERRTATRMFGESLLLDTLAQSAGRSATGIASDLERAVDEYAAERLRDDLAILVVRRLP